MMRNARRLGASDNRLERVLSQEDPRGCALAPDRLGKVAL